MFARKDKAMLDKHNIRRRGVSCLIAMARLADGMVWHVYYTGSEPGSLHPPVYVVTAAVPRETIKETFIYCILSCEYPVSVLVVRSKVLNILRRIHA